MRQHLTITNLRRIGAGIALVLITILPFHAMLSIALGSITGQQELVSIWKEVLVAVLVLLAVLIGLRHIRRHAWQSRWWHRPDLVLIALIVLCGIVASLAGGTWQEYAFLVGVKTSVVPLVLFMAVQPFARQISQRQLIWVLMIPASVVAVVAIWQFFAVPTELLTRLGYSVSTIIPYQGVHPDFPFGRSFATLGGPNQLGAYLIIPAAIALAFAVKGRTRSQRILASIGACGFTLAMITSFSRSALLGFAVASAVTIFLSVPKKFRALSAVGFVGAGIAGALAAWMVLTNAMRTSVDRFLLRGELTSEGILGGDSGHLQALQQGYSAVLSGPIGRGLGTAGPASQYGSRPLITENWYLQIAIEFGVIGLALMLGLIGYIVYTIRHHGPQDPLRIGFVAAIAGVMIANLFLHSLADSTLALLMFAIAGLLCVARPLRGATV